MSDRLVELACRYLDGVISGDEFAELDAMIVADTSAASAFRTISEQARLLSEPLRDRVLRFADAARAADPRPAESRRPPVLRWALAALILVAAAGAAIYVFAFNSKPETRNPKPDAAPIATIIDMQSGAWGSASDALNAGDDIGPQTIRTESGEIEMLLRSNATVHLFGPAELRLDTPMRVAMVKGRATFDCPHDAVGFAVALPHGGRVIDLGTRFEVTVEPDSGYRVEVIEGAVEVALLDGEGGAARTMRLTERSAARGGAGRLDRIETVVRYHDGTASAAPIDTASYVSASDARSTGESWRAEWGAAGPTPAGPLARSDPASQWRMFRGQSTPATPDSASQHIGFSLAYTGDRALLLSELSFDWATASSGVGGGVTLGWTVFASVNGGAFTAIDSAPQAAGLGASVPASAFSAVTTAEADLATLPPLRPGDTIELRIAVADNTGSNSKAAFVQGVRLMGVEAAVPTPTEPERPHADNADTVSP